MVIVQHYPHSAKHYAEASPSPGVLFPIPDTCPACGAVNLLIRWSLTRWPSCQRRRLAVIRRCRADSVSPFRNASRPSSPVTWAPANPRVTASTRSARLRSVARPQGALRPARHRRGPSASLQNLQPAPLPAQSADGFRFAHHPRPARSARAGP